MKNRDICLKLLAAESEVAVQKILENTPEMLNPKNWKPLDNRETNFNVTSNQASDGGKALTELMTNMVDAVLMKHAYKQNIDPRGPDAPKTMYEAVDKLIKNMHGGKLVNMEPSDPWLRDFASKNLIIGITGAKNKKEGLPCYTFVDNGEGQKPDDFRKTFLSLSEGNKRSIHFVQGKYNMGSSGVLGYCGRRWFKLIVSRRFDKKSKWGWTLMRRRPGDEMPVAEYFVLPDGSMPIFDEDAIYPFRKGDGNQYDGVHLSSGTIIKLYDYQVGSRYLSFKGAREALNENLVETILPFRLLDFRQKVDKKRGGDRAEGIDPRPFYGMEFLLLNSHNEGKADNDSENEAEEEDTDEYHIAAEQRISVGLVKHPELGEINITAIALKRNIPSWLRQPNNNRVFHAVNGQVQFKQTRGYLTDCGYPALKDRIVVIVDASNLSFTAHNDVWKGDREHIRNTISGELYKEQVTESIKESGALKALQIKIAREELDRAKTDEGNDLFQKLVDADRNLAGLLTNQDPVIRLPASGGKDGNSPGSGDFKEGKYSPTFLKLDEKVKTSLVEIPINRSRPIGARTDAENGYLSRTDNKGKLNTSNEVSSKFIMRPHLIDGRLVVFMSPISSAISVGDKILVRLELQDSAMASPVGDEFTVRITDEEAHKPKPDKPNKPEYKKKSGDKSDKKEGGGKDAPTHGLPQYRLLTKDGRPIAKQETIKWPPEFTETDGGYVEDLGDNQLLYYINYDNAYHIKYRQQQRGDVARDAVTEKFILGMRILMLGYEHSIKTFQNKFDTGIREYMDEFRKIAAKAAASTVLALAENLPKIVDSGPQETE